MLEPVDRRRLMRLVDDIRHMDIGQVLEDTIGLPLEDDDLAVISAGCVFDHGAILVFPDDISDVTDTLTDIGLRVSAPVPSVVVKERLSRRYGLVGTQLDIAIVHALVGDDASSPKGVEIFCLPRTQASRVLLSRERSESNESHFALLVDHPTPASLSMLRSVLRENLAMRAAGGGYNPYDRASADGRSVLYFETPHHRRLELVCKGHFPDVVRTHLDDASEAQHRVLTILSRHWAARALYATAKLGIADILARKPASAGDVARALDADVDAMGRFLCYLERLGVVCADTVSGIDSSTGLHTRYRLDRVGRLLQFSNPFRDLTLLYGEEFYRAWDNFPNAIVSGTSAFEITFGVDHFEYFSRHPDTAVTFNRAMSAVTRSVADRIDAVYDFSSCSSVVDIGGGDGTLLRAVLEAYPSVRGVLFELDHVGKNAIELDSDIAKRLVTTNGNFFETVPAGHDVYIVARILHDWNDTDCVKILQQCRAACTDDSTLLILERLPAHGVDSLAAAWDMQMLAITGGRERTQQEYQTLATKAGFVVTLVRAVALHIHVLVCRPVP